MAQPRTVPSTYGLREVSAPDTAFSEGRALEQIHKLLQAEPGERFAVRDSQLVLEAADSGTGDSSSSSSLARGRRRPLLLLGIMSGHEARRCVLRSTWNGAREVQDQLRVLFVVGSSGPLSHEWELERATDGPGLLRINISERMRVWKAPPGSKQALRQHQSFTGTFTTYFKQAAFLRFAATQPEPLVGRADDDTFISPHMLLAYAQLLSKVPHPLYGGVFEWISWRAARLEATGFSYGLSEARGRAKAPHRNCSRAVPDAVSDAYDVACLGPFAYAKGPLLVMNQGAIGWLGQAKVFHRDLRRARAMAEGLAPTRKGRIDDDINLGFWMVRMPGLRVLRFRRVVWKDTWRDGAEPALLLAAHKLPWSLHAEVANITRAMWASAPAAQVSALCRADKPPCTSCSHARSQRACVMEIGLETTMTSPRCIHAPTKGSGCPVFVRESHPESGIIGASC